MLELIVVALFGLSLVLTMLLSWLDPLVRPRSRRLLALEVTLVWPGLALLGLVTRLLDGLEMDLVPLGAGGAAIYTSILVFTRGRPALVMDHLFRRELDIDEWTTPLRHRGRVAIGLALAVMLIVLALVFSLTPSLA